MDNQIILTKKEYDMLNSKVNKLASRFEAILKLGYTYNKYKMCNDLHRHCYNCNELITYSKWLKHITEDKHLENMKNKPYSTATIGIDRPKTPPKIREIKIPSKNVKVVKTVPKVKIPIPKKPLITFNEDKKSLELYI